MNRFLLLFLGLAFASPALSVVQQPATSTSGLKSQMSVAPKRLAGTWVLISAEGAEQRHTKIILNPNGTFQFVGPGFKSEGVFSIVEDALSLTYLKSDGVALKQPGKSTLNFVEDGRAFVVNRFKYGKQPYRS